MMVPLNDPKLEHFRKGEPMVNWGSTHGELPRGFSAVILEVTMAVPSTLQNVRLPTLEIDYYLLSTLSPNIHILYTSITYIIIYIYYIHIYIYISMAAYIEYALFQPFGCRRGKQHI
jgi:hypothetical protein